MGGATGTGATAALIPSKLSQSSSPTIARISATSSPRDRCRSSLRLAIIREMRRSHAGEIRDGKSVCALLRAAAFLNEP